MSKSKISIALAATLSVATLSSAFAGNFVLPKESTKLKVVKAQLAIKSPDQGICPMPAKMTGWIFTSKPGKVQYMIAKKGGTVSGPYTANSVKGSNGIHIASFSRTFDVHHSINAEYRILVGKKYGKTLSNWAPLNASC